MAWPATPATWPPPAVSGSRSTLDNLPVPPEVDAAAKADGTTAGVFGALGGEDYELLVAMPEEFGEKEARDCQRTTRVPLTRIGEAVPANRGGRLGHLLAQRRAVSLSGFDHFR